MGLDSKKYIKENTKFTRKICDALLERDIAEYIVSYRNALKHYKRCRKHLKKALKMIKKDIQVAKSQKKIFRLQNLK